MKKMIQTVLLGALLFTVSVSLAHDPPSPPGVVHVVLIWLKEPGNADHRQQIIAGSKQLKDIPGVLDLRVGEVVPSDREVVDASFDVALYLRFASVEELQAYLAHPIHKTAVKEILLPLIDRYRVMDFKDQ